MENVVEKKEKFPLAEFKARLKAWNKEQIKTHYDLLLKHKDDATLTLKIKELGLKLYKEDPIPLETVYSYEKNPEYVALIVEKQSKKTEAEIEDLKDEVEYTDIKIKECLKVMRNGRK